MSDETLKLVLPWIINRLIFLSFVVSTVAIILTIKIWWDVKMDKVFKSSVPRYYISKSRRKK